MTKLLLLLTTLFLSVSAIADNGFPEPFDTALGFVSYSNCEPAGHAITWSNFNSMVAMIEPPNATWRSYLLIDNEGGPGSSQCNTIRPVKASFTGSPDFQFCYGSSGSGSVLLTFEAVGATQWQVQGSVVPNSWYTITTTSLPFASVGVGNEVPTNFRVRGKNQGGWGNWSNPLGYTCTQCGGGQSGW